MNIDIAARSLEEKRKLLDELLRKQTNCVADSPLSFGQERLWELQALDPTSPVYNISIAYDLSGPLDANALETALRAAVTRHESLRTTFARTAGRPVQVVAPEAEVSLNIVDMPNLSHVEWRDTCERMTRREASVPFNLEDRPPRRFSLLRHSDAKQILVITIHHIICDRWSLGILAQEIGRFYAAAVTGEAPPHLESPGTYRAFVESERAAGQSDVAHRQLADWKTRLDGAPPELYLPIDRRSASGSIYLGGREEFTLDPVLLASLQALGLEHGFTLYVVMLAGFAALVHRRTGQEDLLICSPVAGRHRAKSRGVVGYFNNILPLRIDASGRPDFLELMRRVGSEAKNAYERQDLPFQRIAQLPGLGTSALTRCLFSLQNTRSLALELPGITGEHRDIFNGTSNFDLTVFLEERPDGLLGLIDYKANLFDPDTIRRLADDYQTTLRELVQAPTRRLSGGAPTLRRSGPSEASNRPAHGSGPASNAAPVLPVNEVERRLVPIWEDALGVRPLDRTSHFFDLGGHSFMAARLIARVGEMMGRELPLAMLLKAPTVGEFARLLAEEGGTPSWASLVSIRPDGSRSPFFCVHGGAGGVISFRSLAMHLDPDQPFWGLQAQQPTTGDGAAASVEAMAEQYLEAVLNLQPEGPYFLGGHSFGALVAFEMAQRLVASGRQVGLVALIDYPGPSGRVTWRDKLNWHRIVLSQLDREDQLRYLVQGLRWKLRTSSAIPKFVRYAFHRTVYRESAAQTSRRLKTVQSSLSALRAYQVRPYAGRVTLFRATQSSIQAIHADAYGGWGDVALGGVDVYEVPGQHMDLFKEPSVQVLASGLRACLDRARVASAAPPISPE
jgi:thioesterase domain-containing protein